MADPVKMRLWTSVGPRKQVLDEVQIQPYEGAILRGEVASGDPL